MTKERAEYLISNRLLGGELRFSFRQKSDSFGKRLYTDGITRSEHAEIMEQWNKMPGSTCYLQALNSFR